MKKSILIGLLVFISFVPFACMNNDMSNFAKTFIYAINSEDTEKVSALLDSKLNYDWRVVELRDIDPDSIVIKQQSADMFIVESIDSVRFVVRKSPYGYVVSSTFNVIVVDRLKRAFAQKNGIVVTGMDDYTIYSAIISDKYLKIEKEEKIKKREAAIIASNQRKLVSLLEDFEESVSNLDELVKNNDYSICPNFLYTTLGMKALMRAENSRSQVAKYRGFMTDSIKSRYEEANTKFQYYVNNQDSI